MGPRRILPGGMGNGPVPGAPWRRDPRPTYRPMSDRPCPMCDLPLSAGKYATAALEVCLPCAGAWFERGELSKLVQAGPVTVQKLSEHVSFLNQGMAVLE